jgi:hypothetical protein
MSKGIHTYLTIIVIPVAFSCCYFQDRRKVPVARVDQNILYLSEIQGAVPDTVTKDDSILIAEDYVRNWINNELIIKKAQENLTISQKDLAKEIREYKNALLIYRYQKELMMEKLDTTVDEKEIAECYERVREDFLLDTGLVKAISVKIPLSMKEPEKVKAFCESLSERNTEELKLFCKKNGGSCNLYGEHWVNSNLVFQNLPSQPARIAGFLTRFTTWETRDSRFYYLISIQEYVPAGSPAPIDYIRENLKEMIINKRKNAFLEKIKEDIYTEGLNNNKFKIFDYETN